MTISLNRGSKRAMIFAGLLSMGGLLIASAPASAIPTTGDLSFYVDAPHVQASYVDGVTENFDNGCRKEWPGIGTSDVRCVGYAANIFGGASTESSVPTTGGVGTPFATVWADTSMTLNITTPATYFGLWWTAGDGPNQLDFYSDDTLISSFTFYSLVDALSNPTMTADGATYDTADYYGNPVDGSNDGEPYAYLHVFAPTGQTFNKVVFSETGGGFEFDNVTVASTSPDASDSLVILAGPGAPTSAPASDPALASTGFDSALVAGLTFGAVVALVAGLLVRSAARRRRTGA